jgi:hypothetical protein
MSYDLDMVLAQIANLRRGKRSGRPKPHKLLLLLAVLDLADDGMLVSNRIYYQQELIDRFTINFRRYADTIDWCQPSLPFFHLRSCEFWHHQIVAGQEGEYNTLTTSGGGSQRIHRNIEYAYLSDEVFQILLDHTSRIKIRLFIEHLLKDSMEKTSLAFHESFPLRRPSLAEILKLAVEWHSTLDKTKSPNFDVIYQQTSLGTNEVKAMRRYAHAVGLFDNQEKPTLIGKVIHRSDPGMNELKTQWLLHYNLVTPCGSGPAFWAHLVTQLLKPGNHLTSAEVINELERYVSTTEGRNLAPRTIKSTSRIFLSAYNYTDRSDTLNRLQILSAPSDSLFSVDEPEPPTVEVFAYILADYWEGIWSGSKSVALREVTAALMPLLLLDDAAINYYLNSLQHIGLVEVQRKVPPQMVVRLWSDRDVLLSQIYV